MSNTTRRVAIVSAPVPDDLQQAISQHLEIYSVPAGQRIEEAVPEEVRARAIALLCTMRTPVQESLFAALPQLQVVSNFAVGYDNIDVPAATRAGVLVCNTPGVLDAAVADLTIGMALCLGRKLVDNDRFVRSGAWLKGPAPLASDLAGKTFGLLGMGRIGRMVAKRARAFDMNVVYHNRRPDAEAERSGLASYLERDALFSQSDYVSVHIPLGPETTASIGAREFSLMKPTAFFMNTARGAVVDEAALIHALRSGQIAGAGLDVMVKEPLDTASALIDLPNVILQPHVGSATVETRRAMIALAVDNLVNVASGNQPKAMVNESVWPVVAKKAR
ncbi:MAG: D-glycerate dehydrogenase [Herminiimonas sp.]|nr:D-glycerate dehydrogenase [Herminiimonas sp.]MDB5855496.1 D-glycerate dehydrogenase [Herminiimonas sp.]